MSTEPKTITILLALVLVAAPGFPAGGAQPPTDQPPAVSQDVVFVGAGDIANCELLTGARATAALLDGIEGTIFTLGDHAYLKGTDTEFKRCYDPTWGRHKARTRPTPGNHDYLTGRGRPYFEYFGAAAGPDERGYYSFDLGAWHIISLNSSLPAGLSAQAKWLRDDLAAHPVDCVLAYWHAPVFSSGPHAPDPTMRDTWSILYKAGADVVLNGHDHIYERFAPQDDKGKLDAEHGIRAVHRRHRWRRGVQVRKGCGQQRGARQHDLRRVEADPEPRKVCMGVCSDAWLAVYRYRNRCV